MPQKIISRLFDTNFLIKRKIYIRRELIRLRWIFPTYTLITHPTIIIISSRSRNLDMTHTVT